MSDRWFAWLMHRLSGPHDRLLAPRKAPLLRALRGTVVEIGPGTGINLKYYAPGVRWIGIEPNPVLRAGLVAKGADARDGRAEALPLDDESADAVVSTAVLCSVPDLEKALAEVRRVLKPGGQFVFAEHVAASGGALRTFQRALRPLWGCFSGGCDPARDTGAAILRAFPSAKIEPFRLPLGPVGPHICGVATARPLNFTGWAPASR